MIITTRFSIGDKVWLGTTRWMSKPIACPRCAGAGRFKLNDAGGKEFSVTCPDCYGHGSDHEYDFRPMIEQLTVGSVRYDSHDVGEKESYMCIETGVGSGSIWTGKVLFATREEAEVAANAATERARAEALKKQEKEESNDHNPE